MYTSHGHHIPGTVLDDNPPPIARCGGPGLCDACSKEAAAQGMALPQQLESSDEVALRKVHMALFEAGLTVRQVGAVIIEFENAGLIFSVRRE